MLVDDLDGTLLTDEDGEEVFITYKGTAFRIDLSTKNADKLDKVLQPYLNAAEKLGGQRGRPKGSRIIGRPPARSKEELAAIRSWAKSQGIEVSSRGRIAQDIQQKFEEAHQSFLPLSNSTAQSPSEPS